MTNFAVKPERRFCALTGIEIRAGTDGQGPLIAGHAAVFNQPSEDFGGWREQIAPGAFKRTLRNADVRALFNHDANYVLGRNRAGTLSLAEDLQGLAIQVQPPATSWASDLMVSMERGDISQMSFGFRTVKDAWSADEQGVQVRTLQEVELFDVSVVTYPAYPQTDAAVRSFVQAYALDDADPATIADALALITQRSAPSKPGHALAHYRRRLELIERHHGVRQRA